MVRADIFPVFWQFGIFAAEPLIFAPPHPSRAKRGEVEKS